MTTIPLRLFVRRPTYAWLAAALFALGTGAIATIFAVVSVTMLRPLPYRHGDELVRATSTEPAGPGERLDMALGYFQFASWRAESTTFVALEGFTPTTMKLLGGEEPEPVVGALVSAGFFELLGWKPERGRGFTLGEELPRLGCRHHQPRSVGEAIRGGPGDRRQSAQHRRRAAGRRRRDAR